MFEHYTEKSRRVMFFARYEACQFGREQIEPEHLLLGLLREDKPLAMWLVKTSAQVESIRAQMEAAAGPRPSQALRWTCRSARS